ncbi:MerR family transcriptional regulator [Acinetobacter nectaris]|uniref:MerR family transcriptional regulator n=1 Tax=Acinetobacter nectaris TaxID=1219382 RepID=UPI001F2D9CFC|nr:MerR family transcriptional regulator [Acinetobacter nectaris]MCF9000183.1 MerR family transcriptional regulator [Acinetobacter nectaris]MCF9028341.1 MerR family transcriptional regulator [Acinetobacter nectaris]
MNISQFSKKYSIPLDTLRFYEKIKILIPNRLSNGYRDYNCIHEQQVKAIICLKDIGFTLSEIHIISNFKETHPSQECKDHSNEFLNKKIQELDEKIKFFVHAKNQLSEIARFTQENDFIENNEYIENTISKLYSLKTRK